jgi:hypothetical protein
VSKKRQGKVINFSKGERQMNCGDFEKVVHELARDDAREKLGDAATVMGRFHAETCEPCAGRLAAARALAQVLKETAEAEVDLEAPAGLEAQMMTAFREHHRSAARAKSRERRLRTRWAEWTVFAAAAIALVTIGVWSFSRWHVGGTKNPSTNVSGAKNAGPGVAGQPEGGMEAVEGFGSDFVPVPYGESMSADDAGLVVRVSMTRSALGSLGYPVDEMHGEEMIQADLLVGEDGLPRAVRVVQ